MQHFTQSAGLHLVENHGPVTFDLTAVPFCDSSIYSLLDRVAGLPDELAAAVVTGPAIERVLGLLTER